MSWELLTAELKALNKQFTHPDPKELDIVHKDIVTIQHTRYHCHYYRSDSLTIVSVFVASTNVLLWTGHHSPQNSAVSVPGPSLPHSPRSGSSKSVEHIPYCRQSKTSSVSQRSAISMFCVGVAHAYQSKNIIYFFNRYPTPNSKDKEKTK